MWRARLSSRLVLVTDSTSSWSPVNDKRLNASAAAASPARAAEVVGDDELLRTHVALDLHLNNVTDVDDSLLLGGLVGRPRQYLAASVAAAERQTDTVEAAGRRQTVIPRPSGAQHLVKEDDESTSALGRLRACQ